MNNDHAAKRNDAIKQACGESGRVITVRAYTMSVELACFLIDYMSDYWIDLPPCNEKILPDGWLFTLNLQPQGIEIVLTTEDQEIRHEVDWCKLKSRC